MAVFDFDMGEMKSFFEKLGQVAQGELKEEMTLWLEAVGEDFLRVVQDEIVRRNVIDTRLLLASFERGAGGNVWEISDGGLTLEVGTNVEYAEWVESGHSQQPGRFIPGSWSGDRFVYDPSAKGGMVLKMSWVNGKHYFESALRIYEKIFQTSAEIKLQEWLDKYLGGL